MKIMYTKLDRKSYKNGPRYYFHVMTGEYMQPLQTSGWFKEVRKLRDRLSELNLELKSERLYGEYYVQFKYKEDEAYFLLWASNGIEI
jgi:hypothetical protein